MHPRNIYKNARPNFKALALKHQYFREHCYTDAGGTVHLDFKDPESVRALTKVLLEDDFGLNVNLPADSLVPRVPLRLNYVLWIEDLLERLTHIYCCDNIWGIDIGTGASCIYPLLGAKLQNWNFVATERNREAAANAQLNVSANGLENKIKVFSVSENTALCPIIEEQQLEFHFCMCNPPFYDNADDLNDSLRRAGSRPQPHSATVAKSDEIAAQGGEVAFVGRIILDSKKLGTKIKIYTSMVGKKASLAPLKQKLRAIGVEQFATTTFCQGKTLRWALAWTYLKSVDLKIVYEEEMLNKEKPALVLRVEKARFGPDSSLNNVADLVSSILDELSVEKTSEVDRVFENSDYITIEAVAASNTWSQARRKRRAQRSLAAKEEEPFLKKATTVEEGSSASTAVNGTHGCRKVVESDVANDPSEVVNSSNRVDFECGKPAATSDATSAASSAGSPSRLAASSAGSSSESNKNREIPPQSKLFILKFAITVKCSESSDAQEFVELEFELYEGKRDLLHQLYQYFSNRLIGNK